MSFNSPEKAERIAAHRAPTRRQLFAEMFVMLWKFNRRLFWQVTLGTFGAAFIVGAIVAFVVGMMLR